MMGSSAPFPQCLQGERVYIRRDGEFVPRPNDAGQMENAVDGFDGVVTGVSGTWIYVEVADASGSFRGIWVNAALQREIAILG